MGSVATTTATTPLVYPSNTRIDRDKNYGYLYCLVPGTTANTYDLYRSINNGSSWSLFLSRTRSNLVEVGSFFISPDSWARWVYRTNESSQDRIYITGLNLNLASPTWEPELLLANPSNGGVAGAYHQGLDVWATITGSAEYYCVAVGTTVGANSGVTLYGAHTPTIPGGTVSKNSIIRGTRQWLFSGTGRQTPSIDAQHNGDGKTASTPNLWVSFGRVGAYLAKLSWQGDGWQGPTTPVTLVSGISARDYMPGRWDGNEHVTAVPSTDKAVLYERNKANTETAIRTSGAHPQGVIRSLTCSYNKISRDIRVLAVGTSNNDCYYVDYTRATDTWTSWSLLTADDVVGANVDSFGVRRSTYGNNKYDMIAARTTGPQIQHLQVGLSYAPNTPFWSFTGLPYVNGGAVSVSASLTLDWVFDDPDDTDTQSAYALSRQVNGGALNYWRASDSTWQVAEVKNVSGTSLVTLASGWAADGDLVVYKAKVWDSADIPSSYSAALTIIGSTPVNPVITSPGATVTSDSVTVVWTCTEQKAFRVTTEIFGFLLRDSGWIEEAATRSYLSEERLENGFSYTVKLTTKNNEGLASTEQSQSFSVVFTIPQFPTIALAANNTAGYITATMTNLPRVHLAVGTASHANNASVTPGLPAGLLADADGTAVMQLLVVLAAIRNSGTGTVNLPAGYTDLINFGNMRLMCRQFITGDVAPTVTFTGGAAGADCSAQMASFRGGVASVHGTPGTVLNGSAQNIATPAATITQAYTLVLMAGWKQGITTGAAFPAAFTEIFDMSTAVGTGQALNLGYSLQSAAANISTDTITMSGGASAISRAVVVAVNGAPDVSYTEIWRREVGTSDLGVRVATNVAANGTANDFRARSGVAYEYRPLTRGVNGTSRYGNFTQ